jgi:protein TonB
MLLLFIAQIISNPSAPPLRPPKAEKRAIFSSEDYPREAVRNHWEGSVIADLTINPQGRVTGCRIIQSSGHEVLDDATCDLLTRRAMFKPAVDANGNPTADTVRTPQINWKLPR